MAQDDVAAALPVDFVPKTTERIDHLPTRNSRQNAHIATSMISSLIAGGIGSPRSRKLSR
jgi:hypothetical protein